MERELAFHEISHHLEPLCPRDDHKMKIDPDGLRWHQAATNASFKVATYHCEFGGCAVRYVPEHGYFTVVKAPDLPVLLRNPRSTHCSARFTKPGSIAEPNRTASDLNGAVAAMVASTVTWMFRETGCADNANRQSLPTTPHRNGPATPDWYTACESRRGFARGSRWRTAGRNFRPAPLRRQSRRL